MRIVAKTATQMREIRKASKIDYIRQFPGMFDKKTGKPLEYKIDRKIALSILDGADKADRLKVSSRENPCTCSTGLSRVWREQR
jgi:hypothetical protein